MKTNEFTSIITPRILLVPYSAHHVPTYHAWMQDEEIQKATASEPLTVEEEYSMQRSWRTDTDKLTFIVCIHPGEAYCDATTGVPQTHSAASTVGGKQDAPEWMIGDVNLFLYDDDDEEEHDEATSVGANHASKGQRHVIGEIEIMIARKDQQGKGLARETLRAFLGYIQTQLPSIATEFAGARGMELKYLRVKIDKDNIRSLRLFEHVGFVRTSAEPNYFGEVELRTPVVGGRFRDVESLVGLDGFGRMVGYEIYGSQV